MWERRTGTATYVNKLLSALPFLNLMGAETGVEPVMLQLMRLTRYHFSTLQYLGVTDVSTINRLCKFLDCQPSDIMEYVPDDAEKQKTN